MADPPQENLPDARDPTGAYQQSHRAVPLSLASGTKSEKTCTLTP